MPDTATAAPRQDLRPAPATAPLAAPAAPPAAPPAPPPAAAPPATLSPAAPRPPAPRRRGGARWLLAAGLLALGAYAAHQLVLASDLYATEIRFAVRQADPPRALPGAGPLGTAGLTATATESSAVVSYLRSRDGLDGLDARLPLRDLFSDPGIDLLARLPADAPPERRLRHLAGHVRPYLDHTSGIVTVEVSAFSAEAARGLAAAVEAVAEELVNRMSLAARRGLLAAVEAEAAEAGRRLAALRDRLRDFRDANALLDPRRSAVAADALRARLETDIAVQRALIDQQRGFLSDASPALRQQRERLESLQRELAEQIRASTGSGAGALTAALRGYEALEAETLTAERSHEALLATLERTRSDANRQQVYLAPIVRPALPGSPEMGRRWRNLATALGLALLGGLLALLLARAVREHIR